MSLKNARPGPMAVPEYQLSGVPFITGSAEAELDATTPVRVSFPYVTSRLVIQSSGSNPVWVGFSENGVKGIDSGETHRFQLQEPNVQQDTSTNALSRIEIPARCTEVWLMAVQGTAGFQVLATLTGIPVVNMNTLTGSLDDPIYKGVG
jgi:hypothetical protein